MSDSTAPAFAGNASHSSTSEACNPQVMYRSSDSMFFIRERGHTYPASIATAVARFGAVFAECIIAEPLVWIEYDPSDAARIACNRARYEAVGVPLHVDHEITGEPFYGILDHATGEMLRIVCPTYQGALIHIDGIDGQPLQVLPQAAAMSRAIRGEGTSAKIAAGNVAAVEAVTALFNPPGKPAA